MRQFVRRTVFGYFKIFSIRKNLASSKMSSIRKELELTRDNGSLAFDQRCFYETNGYTVIRRFIPVSLLDKCSQRIDDIVMGKVDRNDMVVMHDVSDRKSVNKIQNFTKDKILREYIEYKPMLNIVEAFTGPNIMAMHTMLIAKPPDSGSESSRHPPYQDLYYFPFRPANRIFVSWTAIETCNIQNGCLFVLPGSHNEQKLYAHSYPQGTINKMYHGIQDLPNTLKWQNLEMEPGDMVFFHPLLFHGSGVNRSTRTRKAISCHYAAAECDYIDVRGTVQNEIVQEMLEIARKLYRKSGMDIPNFWGYKS